jgi:hypothetical protein
MRSLFGGASFFAFFRAQSVTLLSDELWIRHEYKPNCKELDET